MSTRKSRTLQDLFALLAEAGERIERGRRGRARRDVLQAALGAPTSTLVAADVQRREADLGLPPKSLSLDDIDTHVTDLVLAAVGIAADLSSELHLPHEDADDVVHVVMRLVLERGESTHSATAAAVAAQALGREDRDEAKRILAMPSNIIGDTYSKEHARAKRLRKALLRRRDDEIVECRKVIADVEGRTEPGVWREMDRALLADLRARLAALRAHDLS